MINAIVTMLSPVLGRFVCNVVLSGFLVFTIVLSMLLFVLLFIVLFSLSFCIFSFSNLSFISSFVVISTDLPSLFILNSTTFSFKIYPDGADV